MFVKGWFRILVDLPVYFGGLFGPHCTVRLRSASMGGTMSGWFGWFKKMVCWMGQKKKTRSCFCRWKHTESDSQTAKRPVTVRLCGGCLLDWVEHDLAGGAWKRLF